MVGPLPISVAACLAVGGIALPTTVVIDKLLDAYDARIAKSHREIVGPMLLPIADLGVVIAGDDLVIELPALALADAVDPVVRGSGMRLVDHLRMRLGGGF
jgi:hypothetical protein